MADDPKAPAPPVKRSAVKGSLISVGGNLSVQVLRLLVNIIVTAMLPREAYGIMGLVTTVLIGLQMMSDMGTRVAIIQNPKGDDPDFLNTAWTIEIGRGAAILIIGCLLSVPLAFLYVEIQDDPRFWDLLYLIPVAALSAFIGAFTSTNIVREVRHLNLGRNVMIDFVSAVLGFATTIVHAYLTKSLWALITGPMVTAVSKTLMSHVFVPGPRNHFRRDPEAMKAIRRTGRWIIVSSGLTFLAQRLDSFLVTGLVTMEDAGVYNIAMILALFPMTIAGPVVNQILLPALSAAQRESHDKLRASLAQARAAVLPIGLLAVLGLEVFAPPFFMIFYKPEYHDAGWITQLYMLVSWFYFLTEAFGRALLAMNEARTLAIAQVTRLVSTAVCAYIGYVYFKLPGFLIGNAIATFAMYGVIVAALRKHGLHDIGADVKFTIAGVAVGVLNVFAGRFAAERLSLPAAWVYVGVGILIYVPLAGLGAKRVLAQVRALKKMKAGAAPVAPEPTPAG